MGVDRSDANPRRWQMVATTAADDIWAEGGLDVDGAMAFSGRGRNWLFEQMKLGVLIFSQPGGKNGSKRSISRVSLKRLLAAGQVAVASAPAAE